MKRLPGEKENSNFSLNTKSDISKASRIENGTKESSMLGHGKKRATTFISPSQNFFGISETKFKQLVRKKSTSNFLPNYGAIDQNKSIINDNLDISMPSQVDKNNPSSSSSNSSEEDEFVNELIDVPPMPKADVSRKSIGEDPRQALMKKNVSCWIDYDLETYQ